MKPQFGSTPQFFPNLCCGDKKNKSTLNICIENHENNREYIVVEPDETINNIKGKIFGGIDPKKSQLYYQRKKLENQWTVQTCQLKDQCKLYIIYGQNIKE